MRERRSKERSDLLLVPFRLVSSGCAAKQEVTCQKVVVRCVKETCVNSLATLAHAASACAFRQCKDTPYKHNVRENNLFLTVPSLLRVIGALALVMPLSGSPPSDDPRSSPRTGSDIDEDNFCFACRAVNLLADEARQDKPGQLKIRSKE